MNTEQWTSVGSFVHNVKQKLCSGREKNLHVFTVFVNGLISFSETISEKVEPFDWAEENSKSKYML